MTPSGARSRTSRKPRPLPFGLLLLCSLSACQENKPDPSSLPKSPPIAAQKREPVPGSERAAPAEKATQGDASPPHPAKQQGVLDRTAALSNRKPFDGKLPWGVGADAKSQYGVVTSVEPAATRAGIAMLQTGGNAIDAAAAVALALSVTHPSAGNLGGGGFLLFRRGDEIEAIDFREDSPAALSEGEFWKMIAAGGHGPHSVGVPGTVAGLFLAHQRHGKLPWDQVVAPAEELAREGYTLGARQAKTIVWAWRDLVSSAVAREVFFEKGKPKKQGTRIKRPRLAVALSRIRKHGAKGFYEGPTASDLVDSVGGPLRLSDLSNYRARVREPLFFDFGDYRVVTMPPPSGGGVALTAQLRMLAALEVEKTAKDSVKRFHLIAEVSRRAQVERHLFVLSPDAAGLEAAHQMRARALDPDTWLSPHPIDPQKATNSADLHPAYRKLMEESEQTTHLSVIDRDSNLVSCTLTLSASYGSHIFSQKTGIVLNNSVASFAAFGKNTPATSQRTVSSMSPTLAFLGDNALVLGSPGGDTIPSTVTQVFLRLAMDGESLIQAVRKPRFHQGFFPQELGMERFAPLSAKLQTGLARLGHDVKALRYAQGDANIAAWTDETAYAVFDRREGGLALGANAPEENTGGSDGPPSP